MSCQSQGCFWQLISGGGAGVLWLLILQPLFTVPIPFHCPHPLGSAALMQIIPYRLDAHGAEQAHCVCSGFFLFSFYAVVFGGFVLYTVKQGSETGAQHAGRIPRVPQPPPVLAASLRRESA